MIQSDANCRAPAALHAPAQRAVIILTMLGLCASFGAMLSYVRASKAQIGADPFYYAEIVKSPIYYVLHSAEILLLFSSGLLALWLTNPRRITSGFRWRFSLFIAAGGLMAARGYTLRTLLSTKLVDATGPFLCLISVLIFVGVRRSNWVAIDKAFLLTAAALSVVILYDISELRTASRVEAIRSTLPEVNALFWPAGWAALRPYPRSAVGRYVRFAPTVVYALGSLFTEMRLNFVMLFMLLSLCSYVDHRHGVPQARRWVVGFGIALWLVMFSMVFLVDTPLFQKLDAATEGFYSRLGDDSRSGQVVEFFRSVEPRELLLGRGSFATWWWSSRGSHADWKGGTDIGYLNLLLYGGVPLLLTYLAVHAAPSLAVLRSGQKGLKLTAGGLVLLWTIRMVSSGTPSLVLEYYPVLICVGACISREPELNRERSSSGGSRAQVRVCPSGASRSLIGH
jgi:hypothetical protein